MVLNLLKKGQVAESLKIIKWLATQRNSYGGFKSTQDTMIAMQALAEYSKIISQEDDNVLKACASYTGSREVTNMVVMEIELLSGFEPITLEELKNNKLVKKVEFDEKENNIAIYFNEMKKEEQCYDLKLEEKIPVKDRKAAIARIYDYYYRKAAIA